MDLGPTLVQYAFILTSYICKDAISNKVTFWSSGGLEFWGRLFTLVQVPMIFSSFMSQHLKMILQFLLHDDDLVQRIILVWAKPVGLFFSSMEAQLVCPHVWLPGVGLVHPSGVCQAQGKSHLALWSSLLHPITFALRWGGGEKVHWLTGPGSHTVLALAYLNLRQQ